MSEPEAKCAVCGTPVSYETGFTLTGGLGDSSQDRLYCPSHAPKQGKGYTLSDLQRMREDGQAERAKYEMSMMELVGPDVYFAVKGGSKPSPAARLLELNRRMYEKFRELGVSGEAEKPR
jgi:hypothetical protein